MERLTGGFQYCKQDGCTETVHPEDYPGFYPFCHLHLDRNINYQKWRNEQRKVTLLGEEINKALK